MHSSFTSSRAGWPFVIVLIIAQVCLRCRSHDCFFSTWRRIMAPLTSSLARKHLMSLRVTSRVMDCSFRAQCEASNSCWLRLGFERRSLRPQWSLTSDVILTDIALHSYHRHLKKTFIRQKYARKWFWFPSINFTERVVLLATHCYLRYKLFFILSKIFLFFVSADDLHLSDSGSDSDWRSHIDTPHTATNLWRHNRSTATTTSTLPTATILTESKNQVTKYSCGLDWSVLIEHIWSLVQDYMLVK